MERDLLNSATCLETSSFLSTVNLGDRWPLRKLFELLLVSAGTVCHILNLLLLMELLLVNVETIDLTKAGSFTTHTFFLNEGRKSRILLLL